MKETLEKVLGEYWESSRCEDLPAKQDPHMAFLMKPKGGTSPGINILF